LLQSDVFGFRHKEVPYTSHKATGTKKEVGSRCAVSREHRHNQGSENGEDPKD
jgi:hypothetical protein